MHSNTQLFRSLLGAIAAATIACGSDATTTGTTTGAGTSAAPASSASSAKAVASASQAPVASASAAPEAGPAPKWWKAEWGPWEGPLGDLGIVTYIPDKVTAKGLPDFEKCEIDGPFLGEGVSMYGAPCAEDTIAGCFEVAQALYQKGRWTCAKAVHEYACKRAPNLTKPPPGGGDYPMVGWPQCPVEKDGRFAQRDKELADPVKKACYVEHRSEACAELAMKLPRDENLHLYLLAVAEAWGK
jgi:hypothetical protein